MPGFLLNLVCFRSKFKPLNPLTIISQTINIPFETEKNAKKTHKKLAQFSKNSEYENFLKNYFSWCPRTIMRNSIQNIFKLQGKKRDINSLKMEFMYLITLRNIRIDANLYPEGLKKLLHSNEPAFYKKECHLLFTSV